ncbi:MAG TPA: SDR family oxidoreductase [Anaerolineae bacterium]|nr:SDR family oxidoreductase [Anaerolineae bacterium]
MKLKNRSALVTGASRGIGRAIALALAQEGADVAVTARTAADLESVRANIARIGVRSAVIVADLSQPDCADIIFREFHQTFDHLDILVNNAGLGSIGKDFQPKPVVEFDDRVWEQTLFVNLTVPYLLCKKFVPEMQQRKYGRIINITSVPARVGLLYGSAYSASKHGLIGFTASLAAEVVKDGITVNGVSPGPVHSATNDRRVAFDSNRLGKQLDDYLSTMTPLGRRLEPEEIAPTVVFLASEEASVITGQNLIVTAGGIFL